MLRAFDDVAVGLKSARDTSRLVATGDDNDENNLVVWCAGNPMQAGFKPRDNASQAVAPTAACRLKSLDFFEFFGTRSKTRLYCRRRYRFTDMMGRKFRSSKPRVIPPA